MQSRTDRIIPRATCIVGDPDHGFSYPAIREHRSRRVVGLSSWSTAQVVECLIEVPEYRKGVLYLDQRDCSELLIGNRRKLECGYVDLQQLYNKATISPTTRMFHSNLLFIPYSGKKFPQTTRMRHLFEWAVQNDLPYVYQHDNDHAWFSEFPSRFEQRVFSLHLRRAAFHFTYHDVHLNRKDWPAIRAGIYTHGWTLDSRECSLDERKIQFVLWGGGSVGLIELRAVASEVNRRLTISSDWTNPFRTKIEDARCTLSSDIAGSDRTS